MSVQEDERNRRDAMLTSENQLKKQEAMALKEYVEENKNKCSQKVLSYATGTARSIGTCTMHL